MYNVGLVVGNVEDSFSNQICKGAMQAAEEMGDNLFIIPAKYLNHTGVPGIEAAQQYEYQYNFLMAYAKSHSLDMILLCLSTVAHKCNKEEYQKILKGFDGIPVFMVASNEEGYSSIMFDNVTGLQDAIRYLIREKGCKKIGMLCGNENNLESNMRLQVYKDELTKANLEIVDSRIVYGDFSEYCVDEAEKLVANNMDLDAIVSGNDSMVKALYKALEKHGRVVGKDIFVTGFDDLDFASRMSPPLASVKADAVEMGYKAFLEVHDILEETEEKALDRMPIRRLAVGTSFVCRESASGMKKERQMFSEEVMMEYEAKKQSFIDANHRLNIVTRDMLMVGDGGENNFSAFLNVLQLESNTCSHLFMLDEPIEYRNKENFDKVDKLYLQAFKMNNKVVEYTKNEKKLQLEEVFDSKWYGEKPKNYIVIDIYSREKQYGVLICDISHAYLFAVENLCYQISMATKIIHLLRVQEELLAEKQIMVQHLEQENLILDNISNTDELTGINNRRGFITGALELLNDEYNIGKLALMIYTDLNYLKRINDEFSHAEGNFALQTCANVLDRVIGERGIVGRLGGDEFAVLCLIDWKEQGQRIKKQILQEIECENDKSEKPYEITMSVGIYEFEIAKECDLKGILGKADEMVYQDKKNKKPFVRR